MAIKLNIINQLCIESIVRIIEQSYTSVYLAALTTAFQINGNHFFSTTTFEPSTRITIISEPREM